MCDLSSISSLFRTMIGYDVKETEASKPLTSTKTASTFDPNDLASIKRASINLIYDNKDSESVFQENMISAIQCLNSKKEENYFDEITNNLLKLVQNYAFYCKSVEIFQKLVESNISKVYSKMIEYNLRQDNLNISILNNLYGGLSELNKSELICEQNVKYDLHQFALKILENGNFTSEEKLKANDSFELYNKLLLFILSMSSQKQKEDLNKIGTLRVLETHLNQLKELDFRKELKYVKMRIVYIVGYLSSENEMRQLTIPSSIIKSIVDILKQTVYASDTESNEEVSNTKYYVTYEIFKSTYYIFAHRIIQRLAKLSVNDAVKKDLFDANVLPLIRELMFNGNSEEIERSSELLSLLCSLDCVYDYFKNNKVFLERVQKLFENTNTKPTTKHFCEKVLNQIITEQWSTERLTQWFLSNNMPDLSKVLKNYNGKNIKCLWELKKEKLERFYDFLNEAVRATEINIDPKEKTELHQKIDDLFQ